MSCEFSAFLTKDGDGQISRKEFEIAVEKVTVDLTKDLDSCFAMLDPNEDDGIDINEFRYAWFNSGKIIRTMDHKQSQSSVHARPCCVDKREEMKALEKLYRERQSLLLSSSM